MISYLFDLAILLKVYFLPNGRSDAWFVASKQEDVHFICFCMMDD